MEYTRKIAEFVAELGYEKIPSRALAAAKEAILDSVGVALAGSQEPVARICAELAREERAKEEAAVFGHGFRSSSAMAAFVNGASGHALDYDASFAIMGQPTAGLVPAVFALSESVRASGRQLLEAYVVGFEVAAKLAWAMPSHSSEGGWHSTGTVGSLGCAAASARLLRLGVEETRMALGIASSMASGVVWNFATMSKPLHAGLAARNGVLAAKLAQRGLTANPSMLEGAGGFFQTFAGGRPYDLKPLEELGNGLEIERGVRFKAYPCGGLTHSAIDAVLALRGEHQITADAVKGIDVQVTAHTGSRIIYRIPETGLQGKFSMPYVVARAVLDGRLTPDTFTDEAIREPAALALAEKVHMEVDPELEDNGGGRRPCKVRIQLKDGRSLSRQVDYPRGTPEAPVSIEELKDKFTSCARRALREGALREAMDMLDNLETMEAVGSLSRLLMGDASRPEAAEN